MRGELSRVAEIRYGQIQNLKREFWITMKNKENPEDSPRVLKGEINGEDIAAVACSLDRYTLLTEC